MEDINALYKALEQADAAGDKESAQELANYIRTLPTDKPITEQPVLDGAQPPVIKPAVPIAPIDVMGQQFTSEDYAKYSGMPIAAKPGEQAKGAFSGSFGRSIYNLAADLALAQGKVTGNTEEAEATAKRLRDYGDKTYTNTAKGWKEDPIAKIQELAGGSAPYMIGPIAAALGSTALGATGIVAAAAPVVTSALQFTGSNLQRQMADNKKLADTSLLKAGATAVPQAILDQIGFRFIPGVKRLFGAAGKEITDEAASALVQKSILSKAGEKVLATGEGMAVEGSTEAAQQLLERLQAGLSITDAEARREYFDSFIGGAALAGAFGVSGQVVESVASKIGQDKQAEVEKETETEIPAEEKRASRDTLVKESLKDLEDKANEINRVKEEAAAQLKAAQTQQVVTEAADLESMAPVNPTELTDTTLTSWGLSKNSKAYKTLIGQDAATPEGRTLIDTALEAHTGKINEPAVDTYKSLLDQQKVEIENGRPITGAATISDAVSGGLDDGTTGGTEGRFGTPVDFSGSLAGINQAGEAPLNAPLEEAPVEEVAPVSTQPKLASQLRALDSTNPLIEALQYDQASKEEVAVAQNTIQELQASRKAKRADLTKVSEEEKDLPQEARGEIQNTGETPDTIEGAFQKQYGKNVRLAKQRGLLNFLNDVSELPPEVGPVTPGTKAVYHKGKGYFITNRITKEDAPRMLLHEIGVHYGLEGMLGTNNYKRIVKQIKQNHLTDKELKASWDNTLKTYPELTENSDNFMQEVIANIGETAPNNSIFRQIVGYIKQFLSKLGYGWNVNNITADDIRDMVQHSVRMSLAGKVKGTQTDTTLAGTEEKPTFFSQLKKEILAHPMPRMPAEQWRTWLTKKAPRKGIKEEEIEYSKIKDFLEQSGSKTSISKDQLANFVQITIPKVETVQLGGVESSETKQLLKESAIKRQEGIDNFGIAINKLRKKLIQSVPDAHYKDIITELPEGWIVRESTEEGGGFDVFTPEGQRMASGDTAEEAKTWAIHDVLNRKLNRERGGNFYWLGPEDGINIEKLVDLVVQDVNDVSETATPDNTPNYGERMEALNAAQQYAPQELDELWGAHYQMRSTQDAFNNAVESTNEDARFTRFTLPGDKEGDVEFAMVFDKNGDVIYTAPQVHSMGREADRNRIVHIRGNIRTDKDGNKVFFVEEIQSDWGQKAYDLRQTAIDNLKRLGFSAEAAKKATPTDYGFKKQLTQVEQDRLVALKESIDRSNEERMNLDAYMDRIIEGREALFASYPDQQAMTRDEAFKQRIKEIGDVAEKARKQRLQLLQEAADMEAEINRLEFEDYDKLNRGPYVADTKAWVTLALKQIFRYAADQGLNTIAFVNGQQSADRYNLSQVIDTVKWHKNSDGSYNLRGQKDGYNRANEYSLNENEIAEKFGQPILNEIKNEEYKLQSDPLRLRLLEAKAARDKALAVRAATYDDIHDWLVINYGMESSDATSFLNAINDLKAADIKAFLDDNSVPETLSKKYANDVFISDRLNKQYNSLMKRHGFGDLSNPIAGDINVKDMELNAEGKGMKEFYNNIVPQAIRDYVKKLGGGEITKTALMGHAFEDQLKVTLSPKAFEAASSPQPLFARMSEEELDRQLAAAGNKRTQKVPPLSLKDLLVQQPLQTVGDIVRNFRKAAFSFDHAINQKIMAAMRKQGLSVEEFAKSFYQMQISQAVKSDQIADLFMIHGDLSYDPNSFKFIVSDVRDSMTSIRDKLAVLAKKYGVSETKMYEYASAAFVARRSQGLNAANRALKKRVLKLMVAGKTSQARIQMQRNYKLVHLTAAEIKAGEKFFNDFKDSNGKSELEKLLTI